jgi:hypothetical protein
MLVLPWEGCQICDDDPAKGWLALESVTSMDCTHVTYVWKLEELARRERVGCDLVAPEDSANPAPRRSLARMVARGGIEPPTRGFSVDCEDDPEEPTTT